MTPDKYTIREFFINVGNDHQLYVYEWGNPKGLPIVFLHGGPGGEIKDKYKEYLDPTKHHAIFFDQRGCGKSLPYGSIEHNTIDDLIADIAKIADQVKFKQFTIYAQSWGACLALAFAIKHTARVKALVLGSIFTGSKREIDWIMRGEFKTFYPEVWEKHLSRTPKAHHHDPASYHLKNILGDNERLVQRSGLAVAEMELNVMSLDDRPRALDPATFDPTSVRIFAHYLAHGCFMSDQHILNNAHKLTMPVWIVHGRYDMDCPPITAYELHQKLPNSQLMWVISSHRNEHENATVLKTILRNLT